jgi:hypothetical protein
MLSLLAEVALLGSLAGCVAAVLVLAQQPGMLLGPWGRWLHRASISHWAVARWLAKPLGGCLFCFAWWVGVAAHAATGLPLWAVPFTAAVACASAVWLYRQLQAV